MPDKVFFQCSLPRVGSTIFQNIINQDSRFYASANNGLLGLVAAASDNYKNSPEFKAQEADLMKNAFSGFCKGSIHGFYNGITNKQYALDKSRGNFANYDLVNGFYPGAKIICFVRNIPDIFASLEKLYRSNQHKSNVITDHSVMRGTTTPKRVDIWVRSYTPMMGYLGKSIFDGTDKKMLFIKYESFCADPQAEMKRFYDYLELPPFDHNYEQIELTVQENEEYYEYTGLFNLRTKLEMKASDATAVLGTDVCNRLMETYKGYNEYFGYK